MKKLLKILLHPLLLATLGLLAASLVIWLVGPLIAIGTMRPLDPVWARLLLIGLIVVAWLGRRAWVAWQARRTNARMMDGLLRHAEAPAETPAGPSLSEAEAGELSKRFADAVSILRQVRISAAGRRPGIGDLLAVTSRQYLYQLPWYVFIGAPGSGKTTALINSGLQFPLSEKFGTNAIKGIGGTRNCDWWFTDEAVLLDTAGRYTTQESNQEVDKAAWERFLALLGKYRPRRPINGIILTVSILDLLQQSAEQREHHAAALRARIQELGERFHVRTPIYVLVTKCDLLAGFMDFFADLGKEDRAQVWGFTLPYRANDPSAAPLADFGAEFEALERRLTARVVDRMHAEHDPQKRAAIFAFPSQFATIGPLLSGFLDQVFSASKYQEPPLLRGVYFTSGTQEGTPIDRIMGTLARAFGVERKILPPQAASGRSYFLTRLLREVVFAEQELAGTNLKWERRRTLLRWAGYAAAGIAAVGLVVGWGVSYSRNGAYLDEVGGRARIVRQAVDRTPNQPTTNLVELLPVLQAAREVALTPANAEGAPLSMEFGLYQGDKLDAAAKISYRRLLADLLLPRIALRIEEQLRGASRDNLEFTYEALKAYLMLHQPEHFDGEALKAWVSLDWERNLDRGVNESQRAQLAAHLDALLDGGPVATPVPMDQALVQNVRALLAAMPLEQRIYSRLRRQRLGADIPEFSVARVAGPAAALVFERASGKPLTEGVPGLFTYDGYYKAFQKQVDQSTRQLASEEPWVLGTGQTLAARLQDLAALGQLTDRVRSLYLEDYAKTWEQYLGDVRVIRGRGLDKTIEAARILSSPDSPLVALLRGAVRETTLVRPDDEKTVVDKATDKVTGTRKSLEELFGAAPATAVTRGASVESIVDDRFAALRRLVKAPATGQPAPVDDLVKLFNEVYVYLTAVDTALRTRAAPPPSDVPNRIKAEAARQPEPVHSILSGVAEGGGQQTLEAERTNLSADIKPLTDFCTRAIGGRYPFVAGSSLDALPEDFAQLFGPGGMFDDFFQKRLAPLVDTSTTPWTYRPVGDQPGKSSSGLVQFQRAARIKDVFFRSGGKTASIRFDFRAVEMDATITQFLLDVDGQPVRYAHGPVVPMSVQWPGSRGGQVRLQLTPPPAPGVAGLVFDGPWALFRMFENLRLEATAQPERFIVTFNTDGRKARFDVLASSVQNPFRLKELREFQCPDGL